MFDIGTEGALILVSVVCMILAVVAVIIRRQLNAS